MIPGKKVWIPKMKKQNGATAVVGITSPKFGRKA